MAVVFPPNATLPDKPIQPARGSILTYEAVVGAIGAGDGKRALESLTQAQQNLITARYGKEQIEGTKKRFEDLEEKVSAIDYKVESYIDMIQLVLSDLDLRVSNTEMGLSVAGEAFNLLGTSLIAALTQTQDEISNQGVDSGS